MTLTPEMIRKMDQITGKIPPDPTGFIDSTTPVSFPTPNPSQTDSTNGHPLGIVGDAVNSIGQGATNLVKGVGSYLIKPVVKGAAMVSAGGLGSTLNAAGAQLSGKSDQEIQAARTAPINVPGLGNINPTTSAANTVGAATDLAGEAFTLGTAGQGGAISAGLKTGLGMALQGGGKAAQADNATAGDVLSRAAVEGTIGGLTGGLLHYGLGKLLGGALQKPLSEMSDKEITKLAPKLNLTPDQINWLKTATPEQQAKQAGYILQAHQYAGNPDALLSPMDNVAQDVTNGVKKLNAIKEQAGAQIGAAKQTIADQGGKPVDFNSLQQLKNNFTQSLESPGIRASWNPDGTIDFSKSVIKNSPGDQKLLQGAWDEIKNAQNSDQLVKAKDTIAQDLDFGKINQQISSSEKYVKDLLYGNKSHDGITGLINEAHPELGKANNIFKELSDAVKAFTKKTSGSTAFTENAPVSGTKTFNLLRQTLGAGAKDNQAILQGIENLGEKYNVPELQNIMENRRLAQNAEDMAGIDQNIRKTSLAGRAKQGLTVLSKAKGGDIFGTMEGIKQIAADKGPTSQAYVKLLQQATKPSPLEKLPIGKDAINFLKLLVSSSGGKTGSAAVNPILNNSDIGALGSLAGGAGGVSLLSPYSNSDNSLLPPQ